MEEELDMMEIVKDFDFSLYMLIALTRMMGWL